MARAAEVGSSSVDRWLATGRRLVEAGDADHPCARLARDIERARAVAAVDRAIAAAQYVIEAGGAE